MSPTSKYHDIQQLIYAHFNGSRHIVVSAVLIHFKKHDDLSYSIMVDRFRNGIKFTDLSEKYGYDIRYIQRILTGKVYKKMIEYLYVFALLDII